MRLIEGFRKRGRMAIYFIENFKEICKIFFSTLYVVYRYIGIVQEIKFEIENLSVGVSCKNVFAQSAEIPRLTSAYICFY